MGQSERSRAETQAQNISSRQKENRSGTEVTVGEGEGAAEESSLEPTSLLRVDVTRTFVWLMPVNWSS
jgi:hypothetical protein